MLGMVGRPVCIQWRIDYLKVNSSQLFNWSISGVCSIRVINNLAALPMQVDYLVASCTNESSLSFRHLSGFITIVMLWGIYIPANIWLLTLCNKSSQ